MDAKNIGNHSRTITRIPIQLPTIWQERNRKEKNYSMRRRESFLDSSLFLFREEWFPRQRT